MKFLVIDDHAAVREGVTHALLQEFPGATALSAQSVEQAIATIAQGLVDCVILDMSLPGRGGLEVLREAKERQPQCRVVVHTMHTESQLGIPAIQAGADGYVTKDRPLKDLMAGVRRVLSGRRCISEELAERLADTVYRKSDGEVFLSDRENQVLSLMCCGKSPSEIAVELNLSPKTVSTYRARLLEKLNIGTTAALIAYGLERGLGKMTSPSRLLQQSGARRTELP